MQKTKQKSLHMPILPTSQCTLFNTTSFFLTCAHETAYTHTEIFVRHVWESKEKVLDVELYL